jgi:hypothetical protein
LTKQIKITIDKIIYNIKKEAILNMLEQ